MADSKVVSNFDQTKNFSTCMQTVFAQLCIWEIAQPSFGLFLGKKASSYSEVVREFTQMMLGWTEQMVYVNDRWLWWWVSMFCALWSPNITFTSEGSW